MLGVFCRVPQICRLKWRQIRAPFWSFGGQSRHAANFGVRAETRTVEVGQVCTTLRKERTCQPDLVRACSIRPGTLRALQQPPDLGIASWSRLSGTASAASLSVFDLFSPSSDLQRFFMNRGKQTVCETRIFDENSGSCVQPGKLPSSCRNGLATSILALNCQKSSSSAECDTTLGTARFAFFFDSRQFARDNLCASGQSMHQFQNSLLPRQSSRIVFVEAQWNTESDQEVRDFRHSPLCMWNSKSRRAIRIFKC